MHHLLQPFKMSQPTENSTYDQSQRPKIPTPEELEQAAQESRKLIPGKRAKGTYPNLQHALQRVREIGEKSDDWTLKMYISRYIKMRKRKYQYRYRMHNEFPKEDPKKATIDTFPYWQRLWLWIREEERMANDLRKEPKKAKRALLVAIVREQQHWAEFVRAVTDKNGKLQLNKKEWLMMKSQHKPDGLIRGENAVVDGNGAGEKKITTG
ncbi:hypothetical protein B0T20DRAFT_401907 [Sordaria brevicollis]|uniref:Uncharacterized protein n=1 Tax=Sordaria brevicollis TaxID=83679 RepID=A0AAE0PKF0_SORBR|nr:hypothetical protein B0T20DRAFT_401907 [Sordaria brevicollis]